MLDRPDPIIYFIAVLPLSLAAVALGYRCAPRDGKSDNVQESWAFGLGQAAIFGLIALILGFSFSFAAQRYEARRALVVTEADALTTAYLRASFLPPARATKFRGILVEYVQTRLKTYAAVGDAQAERGFIEVGKALQGRMWAIASSAALRDPRNPFLVDLTRSVVETMDIAEQQAAALNNHVPRAIIGIDVLCTTFGAFLLGLTFGRAKSPHLILSAIFCVLFAATVFTIIDLDHPQGGLISVDIAPLQAALGDMPR
ncbi:MAG TPA: hypothetical protein VN909_08090 [Candidatus Dormibacteraeota bacterium]|nr:hypothetical protein [Candidatus Dormibacteraeota bacterium]